VAAAIVSVSVLMPVRNGALFLPQAINSILAQTLRELELIVIDDASSDATASILRSCTDPRLRVISLDTPRGIAHALNRGIRESTGSWIARMDADDVSMPKRLERQVAFLCRHLEVAACGTWAIDIDEEGSFLGTRQTPRGQALARNCWYPSPLIHPSVVMRAEVIREFTYDETLDAAQDYDLWFRMASRFRLANLPEYLLLYRVHRDAVTTARESAQLARSLEIFQRHTGRAPNELDYTTPDWSLWPLQHARSFWPAARRSGLSLTAILRHELVYARGWRAWGKQ
jgi:glycosyltransferase involved in cell wall biosynthesis